MRRPSRCERAAALVAACLAVLPAAAQDQTLYGAMVESNAAGMSGYVFVSGAMPDSSLIALARDARKAGMGMILNGFLEDGPNGMEATKRKIGMINSACCANAGAHWQVNPLLFQRYAVKATPAFVTARGNGGGANDFSKVAGDMSVANALKFFGQASQIPEVKRKANEIYVKAFSTQ